MFAANEMGPGPDTAARARPVALIVDDSRLQRKILTASVARWGFDVLEASCASEALDMCRDQAPEVVISDWLMPEMNGLDFCRAFRKLGHDDYTYFILLTAKSEKGEVAEGLEAGADDYLTKPVNAHELRARIFAGQRLLGMQREMQVKNRLVTDTLTELQRVYDAVDEDLRQARDLQQSLVPERFCQFDQGDLSLILQPSGHVGGDLVGYFNAQPGHLGVFAIDVSGHGISSALLTARLAGYLSAASPSQNVALQKRPDGTYQMRPPSEAIEALNSFVLTEMDTQHYFTMALADIDLTNGHVRIGQAGHPHPVIQRANGTVEQVGEGGFPVGLMDIASFTEFEVQLCPGDRLLILSDGVIEAPGPDGALLEDAGLAALVHALKDVSGLGFLVSLVDQVTAFARGKPLDDDISGVLFEYQPRR